MPRVRHPDGDQILMKIISAIAAASTDFVIKMSAQQGFDPEIQPFCSSALQAKSTSKETFTKRFKTDRVALY